MCNVIFQGCMGITQQAFALHNSYLVLICDAKTLSPKKDEELFWTLDWLHALIWHLTLYKRCMGVWKWLPKELVSPLVPKKENKLFFDTGLSQCADQVFDFGDLKLTH